MGIAQCVESLEAIHRLERPVLALLREASQCKDGLKCKLLLLLLRLCSTSFAPAPC